MTDSIQGFPDVTDVGPDLTDPDVFFEEYLKSKGLPELSEQTATEKECQCIAEKAREEYKTWSEGMERLHMGLQVRTSMLPDSMKYAYRLYRNKKSAHAAKVYKTAYRHLLSKRLLEMEAVIASYNAEAVRPPTRNDQVANDTQNGLVGQDARVKHEAKTINDVNSEVCNQEISIEFNEKENTATVYGMSESELMEFQLFVNNLEDPPEQIEMIINPNGRVVTGGNITGTTDEVALLDFRASTTGAGKNGDGSGATENVYGNDLGGFGDVGVEGNHVPQHHYPGFGTNSGGIRAVEGHQESAPAILTGEQGDGVIHVDCLHDRSKDDTPGRNDGYSTGASTPGRFTHLHRCNETFVKLFNSNVAGSESGNDDSMFQEIMTEALAEEISNVELPQSENLTRASRGKQKTKNVALETWNALAL